LEKIQDKIVIFTSTICNPNGSQITLSCPNTVNLLSALPSAMRPWKRPWM
jgi:hypothetical protein